MGQLDRYVDVIGTGCSFCYGAATELIVIPRFALYFGGISMRRISMLLIAGILCSQYINAQDSSTKSLLSAIVQSSLDRKCYYQQGISLKSNLLEVIGLLGEPKEKYSVESIGYYEYGSYAIGFDNSLQSLTGTSKVALFDYFIDLSYADIQEIMGRNYEITAFPEYRTFTLRYRIDSIVFDFTPEYGDDIQVKLSTYDPLFEQEKYETNARLYVSKCSFRVLTVFESMQ
jgi:hypothetical protein